MTQVCTTLPNCMALLDQTFQYLSSTLPNFRPELNPAAMAADIEKTCHAQFAVKDNAYTLTIRGTYPNHPSQYCLPKGKTELSCGNVDVAKAAEYLAVTQVTHMGNTGSSAERFAYIQFTPTKLPQFSNVPNPNTFFGGPATWSGKFNTIREVMLALAALRGQAVLTPKAAGIPKTENWGIATEKRWAEVTTVLPGGRPSHPPDHPGADPNATPQCDLAQGYWKIAYENRPLLATDGTTPGFAKGLRDLGVVVRAERSDETYIQTSIDLSRLRQQGMVTLAHNAEDTRHVTTVWGNNTEAITELQKRSLFTITLTLKKGN